MTLNIDAPGQPARRTTEPRSRLRTREAVPEREVYAPLMWSVCKVICVS